MMEPATSARHFLFIRAIAYALGSARSMHQNVTSKDMRIVFQTMAG